MKYRIKTEKKYRVCYERREVSVKLYKSIEYNRFLSFNLRFRTSNKLARLVGTSGIARLKNYCIFTGRSRGVVSKFGVSRIMLRELFFGGKVYGVIKSSW
jgi:ribosomal protein S14